ncbi:hypothetical protein AMTRI_Chr13g89650 [Amborella trichopoda]
MFLLIYILFHDVMGEANLESDVLANGGVSRDSLWVVADNFHHRDADSPSRRCIHLAICYFLIHFNKFASY